MARAALFQAAALGFLLGDNVIITGPRGTGCLTRGICFSGHDDFFLKTFRRAVSLCFKLTAALSAHFNIRPEYLLRDTLAAAQQEVCSSITSPTKGITTQDPSRFKEPVNGMLP